MMRELHERDLPAHPDLAALVAERDAAVPPIGYERLLYRHLFLLPERRTYVRLIRDEANRLLVPLHLEDAGVHAELVRHCRNTGFRLLVLDAYRDWLAQGARLLPVGVWHDLPLADFSLEGGSRRKLRYMARKFEASADVDLVEYDPAAPDAPRAPVRDLMIRWAQAKGTVIGHSAACMEDLLRGPLPPAHRAFLACHDGRPCTVIVVERAADGTWIMDQEFYDPATAPPGHMEYAVVKIMERLRAEGAARFSLGLTWHPFAFRDDPRADPRGWAWLTDHVDKGTLLTKVFEEGRANHQFKAKFAPEDQPFFAYFPDDLPFDALLKFWPVFLRNALPAARLTRQLQDLPIAAPLPAAGETREQAGRRAALRRAGTVRDLAEADVPLDLQTDSWWGRQAPFIQREAAALRARSPAARLAAAKAFRHLLPFRHVIPTGRGREAEGLFYRAFRERGARILSTPAWTTTLAHQLGNGFTVEELPHPALAAPADPFPFKGEMDLDLLRARLREGGVTMAGIELLSNAAGGAPVRLEHLRALRALLAPQGVPLVMDATRVARNAALLLRLGAAPRGLGLWELARDLMAQADHVILSLPKDFAVPEGGLIATDDDRLAAAVRALLAQGEGGMPADPVFPDLSRAAALVEAQLDFIGRLGRALSDQGVPLLAPAGGHALVVDTTPWGPDAADRVLEDLFVATGIRGGLHQAGKRRNTWLNRCIRLALPLGLRAADEERIARELSSFFARALPQAGRGEPPLEVPRPVPPLRPEPAPAASGDIAIIGFAGRFPEADDYVAFWDKLRQGATFIRPVPAARWDHAAYVQPGAPVAGKTRCRFGAFIDGVDRFDADFFGLRPEEVRIMDPQERLCLHAAWSCIEDAGYRPETLNGAPEGVGLFSGITYNDHQKLIPVTNHSCFVNARIAYFFDVQGPSASVDTGCCSSLSALDLACQSLRQGACATALVLGANLLIHPDHYVGLSSLLSSADQPGCHPLGRDDGWIPAEGVAAALLKPLDRALADGDHIHGVIKSARVRQEGRTTWFAAPNPRRQADLIRGHFARSGIAPDTISYIELAANGSPLGDSVEIEGQAQAFGPPAAGTPRRAIGTVKAGLGHGEAVSTLMQLAHVLLMFKRRELLPLAGGGPLNPKLDLERTPFYLPSVPAPWTSPNGVPRRATISSFGGGGHMGHLILEEPPQSSAGRESGGQEACFLPLSSATPAQLRQTAARLLAHLEGEERVEASPVDIMFTLCAGRRAFPERVAFHASSVAQWCALLRVFLEGGSDPRILRPGTAALTGEAPWLEPARSWLAGGDPSWEAYFRGRPVRRVPLPGYSFAPRSFPLPRVEASPAPAGGEPAAQACRRILAAVLDAAPETLDLDQPLDRCGFDSVVVNQLTAALEAGFGEVSPTLFFQCRTLGDVVAAVTEKAASPNDFKPVAPVSHPRDKTDATAPEPRERDGDIAIIGLAGRFPGADTPEALWRLLAAGGDAVRDIPPERWRWQDYFEPDRHRAAESGRTYSRWGGFIAGPDRFDAAFFNISPREARAMDPQERLVLECAWAALEDAGQTRARLASAQVGVYVGSSWQDYPLFGGNALTDTRPPAATNACNIANRVSYWFGFKGASLTLDTACSSSLTALHMACRALRAGEEDVALVGGVNLTLHPNKYLALAQGQFLSARGRCASFGADADGYVPGEAVVAVVLKPKALALADGDPIHGIIRGSAIRHGGKTNGYAVPDPAAQAQVVARALADAGVEPGQVGYVEAHGTGTALGDPIEIEGLAQVFRPAWRAGAPACAIGSVKSNVGHCEAASGLVGLAKILLQFRHGGLAPSLHAQRLNARIDFSATPFAVQRALAPWPAREGHPRLAGLSSFGAGGTNVHVVIEEPPIAPRSPEERPQAVVLSAWTLDRLKARAAQLRDALETDTPPALADLAHTLQVGREAMPERLGLVAHSVADLREKLAAFCRGDEAGLHRGRARAGVAPAEDMAGTDPDILLARWVRGAPVAWERCWTGMPVRRVSLPTYPFKGERHWIADAPRGTSRAARDQEHAPAASWPTDLHLFDERWEPAAGPEPDPTFAGTLRRVLCLGAGPAARAALTALAAAEPLELRFHDPDEAGVAALGPVDAVLDLTALEQRAPEAGAPRALFRALARAGAPPRRVLLAGRFTDGLERAHLESWIGFERSLKLAWPQCGIVTFLACAEQPEDFDLYATVWRELTAAAPGAVLWQNGRRARLALHPLPVDAVSEPAPQSAATVLITGGCGGLGLKLAEHLAGKGPVNLILTGRSPLDTGRAARIADLERKGARVLYLRADAADRQAMAAALAQGRQLFGGIEGVFHAAGVSDPRPVWDKPDAAFAAVLAPKVRAALALDELLADDPLRYVCYFSSSSAVLGDFGACDYAVANRFLMTYARHRNALADAGLRRGRALAVAWPLWREGGMGLTDPAGVDFYLKSSGQRLLETGEGLAVLDRLLAGGPAQALVLAGEAGAVARVARRFEAPAAAPMTPVPERRMELHGLTPRECAVLEVSRVAAEVLELPDAGLERDRNLADFGFDSISLGDYARRLSALFAVEVTPDVFFGHSTLDALADWLLRTHGPALEALLRDAARPEPMPSRDTDVRPVPAVRAPEPRAGGFEPIAILGMSGRFAKARSVDELWRILASGEEAITEIPPERFDWRAVFGDPREPGKTNGRWCGLVPGVDEFDPLFFEISPREAAAMDPRQRLLLQEAWNALEDAAYGPSRLARERVGMFVGVEEGDYVGVLAQAGAGVGITGSHTGILAARLAYVLNLGGPVMALNTACSSGLVAVHQACQSLRLGECEAAIAAGVSLMLTPAALVGMGQAGMLSGDGHCRAFARDANGLVPGEAVAAVVLKPLARALADGDPVQGVILGSGVNYDGKTNGITAPSAVAQGRLIRSVREACGVEARRIGHIVTHGTGTALGDPVEIKALEEAFRGEGLGVGACALTSVKGNVGHSFAASGVVSLMAQVLSLRHGTIPASLNCAVESEHVRWGESAFRVNKTACAWPEVAGGRVGGVSAFGMSGTNAHVLVGEAPGVEMPEAPVRPYEVLVVSAKSAEALRSRAVELARALEGEELGSVPLARIAYSLVEGRHAFRHRAAVVVRDHADAAAMLGRVGAGSHPNLFQGEMAADFTPRPVIARSLEEMVNRFRQESEPQASRDLLQAIAELHCQGYAVPDLLPPDASRARVRLPTYPFARERHWPRRAPEPLPQSPHEESAPKDCVSVSSVDEARGAPADPVPRIDTLLYHPLWQDLAAPVRSHPPARRLLVTAGLPAGLSAAPALADLERLVLGVGAGSLAARYTDAAVALLARLRRLLGTRDHEDLLLQLVVPERGEGRLLAGLMGMLRSAALEAPGLAVQVIELDPALAAADARALLDAAACHAGPALHLRAEQGRLSARAWMEMVALDDARPPCGWRADGVYLITGGMGGLGRIFLADITARAPGARVILCGRSDLIAERRQGLGARVEYCRADLSHPGEVAGLVRHIRNRHGRLDGVLHAAGVLRDGLIRTKTEQEARSVLAPKVAGSLALLEAVKALAPGFVALFSSAAGVHGNVGQADYAAASAFQDLLADGGFAGPGRILSLAWPLWRDGGMTMDPESRAALRRRTGLTPLDSARGLAAFHHALALEAPVVMVLNGEAARLRAAPAEAAPAASTPPPADAGTLVQRVQVALTRVVAEHLGLPPASLRPRDLLEGYGVDSIVGTQVKHLLEERFPGITSTLFYEHPTLEALARYFVDAHRPACEAWVGEGPAAPEARAPEAAMPAPMPLRAPQDSAAIAVIGFSGRFPDADTPAAFWDNLCAGRVSIGPVPAARWRAPPEQRGAFVSDPFGFDPLFFGLTPRDAARIDPQERLFLMEAWKALEDAGYAPSRLPEDVRAHGAVFAGITKQGFNLLARQEAGDYLSTSPAALVHRVSHHLDLRGPSLAVDAMCASALVAVHEACDFLLQRGGRLAIAGGVNLYLHPATYRGLELSQGLARDPEAGAFAAEGTGFVPGEGVGAVVLKRHADAVRDGDTIHALILGSAAGHGGRGAAPGTPNPAQQVRVIRQALARAGVDARTISHVEAAANGQSAADAVELVALAQVFADRSGCAGTYGLGTLKPNVGHGEAASGMAQLIKVILSLKAGRRAPTRLASPVNPEIRFDRLPFQPSTTLEAWEPVTVDAIAVPRRAGITAVGAGGVCAHLVLEEAAPSAQAPAADIPRLFPFSARTAERLRETARRWLAHLAEHADLDLAALAQTLQEGREPFASRLAILARTGADLVARLRAWQEGPPDVPVAESWSGTAGAGPAQETVAQALAARDLDALAAAWVAGADVAWDALRGDAPPARLSGLPTYPFENRRCHHGDAPEVAAPAHENKAAEFYAIAAEAADPAFHEEYLTFAPFPERIDGFSVTRVCFDPARYPQEIALIQARQREMRDTLFGLADIAGARRLLDIGCGHGTDVIRFAEAHPRLEAHGFTITRSQAELGSRRLAERGLKGRAAIFHKDSARDPFPAEDYDVVIGVEVTFHIRDKAALFGKIAAALAPGGAVLLADYIANTRGAIVDPGVEITIPTRSQWVDLLSTAGLVVDTLIDVSPQIANFLHDPECERNIAHLPQVGQDTWRNYVNQSAALDQGRISYVLMRLSRDPGLDLKPFQEKCDPLFRPELRENKDLEHFGASGERANALAARRQRNAARLADPRPYVTRALPQECGPVPASPHAVQALLRDVFAATLGLAPGDLDGAVRFRDLGIGSVNALDLLEAINGRFDLDLPTSVIFEHDTLEAFAHFLAGRLRPGWDAAPRVEAPAPTPRPATSEAIAVVGLACRCAGAEDAEGLWRLVREGRECLSELPPAWRAFIARHATRPAEIRYGAMAGVDLFDPLFFRLSPREAEHMDVSQRLLLEEGYRALEEAGYAPGALAGQRVGCYFGLTGGGLPMDEAAPHLSMLGGDSAISASRLAHFLDLKGPVLAINTACSSSLVAIDAACQALKAGRVDMALAGGVTVWTDPAAFLCMNEAGMLSPRGACRPFDDEADGIVVGDGVGIVVLKRLADAERDGDHIHGVIRGSDTNQDGRTSGITVPSFLAQSQLQARVYDECGIDVEAIQYIEAHGTATKLGDPVEIHALSETFNARTARRRFCAIGSLKANIGHTAAAAGVLGLIKLLLCLRHRQFPPAVHFSRPNRHIDFADSPVEVNTRLRPWPAPAEGGRLAALSSFGYSGTNAHLVLEEPPAPARSGPGQAGAPVLVVLSAARAAGLKDLAEAWLVFLEGVEEADLSALAFTAQMGRDALDERLALVVESLADLRAGLAAHVSGAADAAGPRLFRGSARRDGADLGSPEARERRWRAWIVRRDLESLARFWAQGASVDFAGLWGAARPRRMSLPTCRFSRERYPLAGREGVREAAPVPAPTREPPAPPPPEVVAMRPPARSPDASLLCFTEDWVPVPEPLPDGAMTAGTWLCLLGDPAHRRLLGEALARRAPGVRLVFAAAGEEARVFAQVAAAGTALAGVLDLRFLEAMPGDGIAQVAALLRGLHGAGLTPGRIVLAGQYRDGLERCYLESWIGFERSLPRAWPQTRLGVVIGEERPGEDFGVWPDRIWAMACRPEGGSVLYQDGVACELKVRAAQEPQAAPLALGAE